MNDPVRMYIPQDIAGRLRGQAKRVWAVAALIAAAWVAVILVPAAAAANGFGEISSGLYGFFSYICHQIPERSFHLAGHAFGVCSRCFGVYFGLFAGLAGYPLWRKTDDIEPVARFWLFLSMVPIAIDWSLTVFGIWENTHLSRLITGMILGFACATFIVPALVEITRNFTLRRMQRATADNA